FSESGFHGWNGFRLHADDTNLWIERLEHESDARNQSTPAHRRDHRIQVRILFVNLHRDGTLAGNDPRVVKAVNQSESFFLGEALSLREGRVVVGAVEYGLGAIVPNPAELDERSMKRHANCRRDL